MIVNFKQLAIDMQLYNNFNDDTVFQLAVYAYYPVQIGSLKELQSVTWACVTYWPTYRFFSILARLRFSRRRINLKLWSCLKLPRNSKIWKLVQITMNSNLRLSLIVLKLSNLRRAPKRRRKRMNGEKFSFPFGAWAKLAHTISATDYLA